MNTGIPQKRVLCFAPHPDDEIIGCGGSLIKARKKKCKIYICYLTLGEQGSPKYSPDKLKELRKEESYEVCKQLGIHRNNIFFLNIPDNQINTNDFKSFVKVISLIRKIKPDLVYIPHEKESYYDHRQASLLIQRALDMAGSNNFSKYGGSAWWVDNVLAYEVSTPLNKYQYSEDISKVINEKIRLLKIYKTQTYVNGNISDFVGDNVKFLSGYRASVSVGKYREAFQVLRVLDIL